MKILFLPDHITVNAEVGEPILEVAERAGVTIPTGCLIGSCHACEVELNDSQIICACITAIPPGEKEMTINLSLDMDW
ncbi:MAG: 2Fe-2S iron-sulfur cluster binding domain-containing protein [Trichodesmium sp. St5_bin2_1]|jgi:ferredoxin|nr:2Fe-2S iron-sulfur cluster binding domain-containing protein [Trichodesmium sp. MAG_R02]MDE5075548.1 2Fe-2S iron-sulfur cluster binding domain-containing protein [Trichodesmium sp. St5_bin2_1]MDE5106498.1 2Fe-2S iron-sulfur cluster binding domain-containing protein [Trichodesmium sp. St17_bin3_1_1]MDE5116723.1 2Fe-2S iron-sulfur cluster binding domain-containing protein [Trichodesmium sp. St2_bin2_1]